MTLANYRRKQTVKLYVKAVKYGVQRIYNGVPVWVLVVSNILLIGTL